MHQIDPMNREITMVVLVDFLSHKFEISRKKNILGTSLEKSKTTHAAEKFNLILLWSE